MSFRLLPLNPCPLATPWMFRLKCGPFGAPLPVPALAVRTDTASSVATTVIADSAAFLMAFSLLALLVDRSRRGRPQPLTLGSKLASVAGATPRTGDPGQNRVRASVPHGDRRRGAAHAGRCRRGDRGVLPTHGWGKRREPTALPARARGGSARGHGCRRPRDRLRRREGLRRLP